MTLVDALLIVIVVSFIAYRLGRSQSLDEHNKDHDLKVIEIKNLTIEKINDMYYVYVGNDFAGQSKSIDELVLNMRDIYKVTLFNFDKLEGISTEEYDLFVKSIEKWYTVV